MYKVGKVEQKHSVGKGNKTNPDLFAVYYPDMKRTQCLLKILISVDTCSGLETLGLRLEFTMKTHQKSLAFSRAVRHLKDDFQLGWQCYMSYFEKLFSFGLDKDSFLLSWLNNCVQLSHSTCTLKVLKALPFCLRRKLTSLARPSAKAEREKRGYAKQVTA